MINTQSDTDEIIGLYSVALHCLEHYKQGNLGNDALQTISLHYFDPENFPSNKDLNAEYEMHCKNFKIEQFCFVANQTALLRQLVDFCDKLGRIFPQYKKQIDIETCIVLDIIIQNEDTLEKAKVEDDDHMILNDLSRKDSTIFNLYDRHKNADIASPAPNIHTAQGNTKILQKFCIDIADESHSISKSFSVQAQMRVAYCHHVTSQNYTPTITDRFDHLSHKERVEFIINHADQDLKSSSSATKDNYKILHTVQKITEFCFPKNAHQLGLPKFNP